MITDIKQEDKGTKECIFDLKDGQEVTLENALKMAEHFEMNRTKLSTIFTEFFKYDKRELKVRTNIDTLIKTGMYEMAKKEVDKKKQEMNEEKDIPKITEPEIQLVTKKK